MKQIMVLSNPISLPDETVVINGLFDAGLMVFHLRKPDYSLDKLNELLCGIKKEYHKRISLPATLLDTAIFEKTGSKMVHFFEYLREHTEPAVFKKLKEQGLILSTSIHNGDTYDTLPAAFDYSFFSPVFDSISKHGYTAMDKEELLMLRRKDTTKVIALGGIEESNCLQALDYGFDGIALLGGIWESKNPVDAFKRIWEKVSTYES